MTKEQEELQKLRKQLSDLINYINWLLQDYKRAKSTETIRQLCRQKNALIAEIYKKDPDWR